MNFSARLKLIPSADGYDVMCALKSHDFGSQTNAYTSPYIRSITFYVNNVEAAVLQLGENVSYNPIVGIHLTTLKPYDEVSIMWMDNLSRRGTATVFVG